MNLHVNFHSQLASKDLDGSEQFVLGGANGVRAYPQGEASGDSGYQATAELRYATPVPDLTRQLMWIGAKSSCLKAMVSTAVWPVGDWACSTPRLTITICGLTMRASWAVKSLPVKKVIKTAGCGFWHINFFK